MTTHQFNFNMWYSQVSKAESAFMSLDTLVTDPDTLKDHLLRIEKENQEYENAEKSVITQDLLRILTIEGIRNAHAIHRRQMIVYIATLFEAIQFDYLKVLFFFYPERMYNYIGVSQQHDNKGQLSLSRIIDSSSKEELLEELAEEASRKIISMKYPNSLKNTEKVSKMKFDTKLFEKFQEFLYQRNRIVHEASEEQITTNRVLEVFYLLRSFMNSLHKMAKKNKISISDLEALVNNLSKGKVKTDK